jgi:hypothetical protein
MALREFTDEGGRRWRAWDVAPEQLHPVTRAEDYLQGFLEGWLVFESADGRDKIRLTPVPARWAVAGEGELRALLDQAEHAALTDRALERVAGAGLHDGEWSAVHDIGRPTQPAPTVRTFRYPGGRYWTVREHRVSLRRSPGAPARRSRESAVVLRFTSGRRSLDLLAWPRRWHDYDDQGLAELLWRAFPRDPGVQPSGAKRRRRGDEPPAISQLQSAPRA